MSRTLKDAPYKIREKRLGITEHKENCILCADNPQKTITTGFTGIFFAHEVKEAEAFIQRAEELGYSVKKTEIRGYLGENIEEEARRGRYSFRQNRAKSNFEGLVNLSRAIYNEPRGKFKNLAWNDAGKFSYESYSSEHDSQLKSLGFNRNTFSLENFFELPYVNVSAKENIFVAVSVSIETSVRGNYHYHSTRNDSLGYLIYGHCHCSWCTGDDSSTKTRFRAASNGITRAFNSGDIEAVEELSEEFALQQGSNATPYVSSC